MYNVLCLSFSTPLLCKATCNSAWLSGGKQGQLVASYRLHLPPLRLHLCRPSVIATCNSLEVVYSNIHFPLPPTWQTLTFLTGYIKLHFPGFLADCLFVTNFWPISHKKTLFLSLQEVSKKKGAHLSSPFFCLGYESDGWSFSSHFDNIIGQKNKMRLVLTMHRAALSISELVCERKIK